MKKPKTLNSYLMFPTIKYYCWNYSKKECYLEALVFLNLGELSAKMLIEKKPKKEGIYYAIHYKKRTEVVPPSFF